MTDLETIKYLSKLEPTYDHTWVGSNPNRAFMICIGAGPNGDGTFWITYDNIENLKFHFVNFNVDVVEEI